MRASRPFQITVLLLLSSVWTAAAYANPPQETVTRELAATRPPSWIKWLGWAADGTRIAWREGEHGTGNVPGRPVWIARLNPQGAIVDRHFRRTAVQKALDSRGIARRSPLLVEDVTPRDALVQTSAGELYAVALRGNPPTVAVLRKRGQEYGLLARKQVLGPAVDLRVTAEEEPGGRLMVLVVHTGRDRRRQASLFILQLQPKVDGRDTAMTLPYSATATTRRDRPSAPERTRPRP